MDCRVPQSCSLVMERPGPSSPEILSPENFSPVSGKVLDGRDGLLGCLHLRCLFPIVHRPGGEHPTSSPYPPSTFSY